MEDEGGREGGDHDESGKARHWLLLVYRIPSEPTRLRATAWRRLRSLGAIYLQSGVAALPDDAGAERALRKLRHDILQMAGSAVLLRCEAVAGGADVLQSFQAARGEEYDEIVDKCHDFLAQVAKEHEAEHFSFAELEENEVDLVKLRGWFTKVSERDVFGAPGKQAAEALLAECEASLEGYAAEVYVLDPDAS